ncbi:MAG TPA: Hsp20/alpha crystallin family protein [Anaerolineales bacterium]|nr:Hsp20/alpha crystallin family protein [Anaerolineales bacterium]
MTFYLQSYPTNRIQRRPRRRMERRWVENDQQSLSVNIREEDEAFVLSALVPGLNAEDLNIQILDDVVRIDGEYRLDERQYLMQELPYGSFTRTLRLPVPIEANSVEAKIDDGVLTLTLPKAESSKPKRISIKSK